MPVALDKDDSISDSLPPPISPTILVTPTELEGENKNFYTQNLQLQPLNLGDESDKKKELTLEVTEESVKKSDSTEFLSPSPVFRFDSFDSKSLDMLVTPDELANNSFLLGLSNVNYDIEFSDISGDNSIADDVSPEKPVQKDPFSPVENIPNLITQPPLIPNVLEEPSTSKSPQPDEMSTSIIDETATTENLPSPIKPCNSEYSGFSTQGWQIPSIPCNTGDYNKAYSSPSKSNTTPQNGVVENKTNNDDTGVRILGGVLETLDKIF